MTEMTGWGTGRQAFGGACGETSAKTGVWPAPASLRLRDHSRLQRLLYEA